MLDPIRRLWTRLTYTENAKRSILNKQSLFMGLLLAVAVVFATSEGALADPGTFYAGVALAVVATIVAGLIPWERIPLTWSGLLPVADFIAVGLLRYSVAPHLIAVSLLMFLPTVWLVTLYRNVGLFIATALALLTVGIPVLSDEVGQFGAVDVVRVLLLPLTVFQVGWFMSGLLLYVERANERIQQETDAKMALHEESARQARLLQNIIDSVDVGIIVVDRRGNIVFRNHYQRQILDFVTPAGMTDPTEADLLEFLPNTDIPVPPERRPLRRATLAESYSNYLVLMGPPEGEQRVVSTTARQITDSRGERDGAVISFTDVTFHMKAVQSQSRFLSMVSHELRTPLTSIVGYLDLARDEELPPAAAGYLDVVNRNAEQLLVIVEDLLHSQKLANEKLTFKRRPERLDRLAELACDSAQASAAAKGITLERHLEPTPVASLDLARLSQVLDNLLSNAIKFTAPGGTVKVATQVTASTMDVVVSDTGIGMTPEEQSHLYTRFYRTDGATEHHIPGAGLGLAISRDIVHGHGGQISVASEPGVGTTFRVSLPLPGHDRADVGRSQTQESPIRAN
ncbi:PAS domain-containing sensor histidine kinase [Tessaracoccus sp. OS52]|uniref:sensor histidine kinase n=1 Tax=Tessaracoccus sp. OS52 TaxID=2886691 RepID=UPI001D12838A|nr:PAS domain-containing sensor histidine kinase [Tessaracoccus sp. OS52]MCC2594346.1 PAS domain-containing sensor histidine kinase [Tessaracoccus sp. OS52]